MVRMRSVTVFRSASMAPGGPFFSLHHLSDPDAERDPVRVGHGPAGIVWGVRWRVVFPPFVEAESAYHRPAGGSLREAAGDAGGISAAFRFPEGTPPVGGDSTGHGPKKGPHPRGVTEARDCLRTRCLHSMPLARPHGVHRFFFDRPGVARERHRPATLFVPSGNPNSHRPVPGGNPAATPRRMFLLGTKGTRFPRVDLVFEAASRRAFSLRKCVLDKAGL